MDFRSSLNHFPPEVSSKLFASFSKERTHALYLNAKKMPEEVFLSRFPKLTPHPFIPHAYLYDPEDYEFGKSCLYDFGVYSIQDASAMVPPFALNPKKGERILDLCASPGGKSILASLLMEGGGVLLSNDISPARAKDLSSNIERMGLGNVIVANQDFSEAYSRFLETFDGILLDAPCSGSFMFRKNAQAEREWSEQKVRRCACIQRSLLESCYAMLKKGGRMVYSTCSLSFQENEGMILDFLSRHPDMKPAAIPEEEGFCHPSSLKEAVYLLPCFFPGEGQFLCLLRKGGSSPLEPEAKEKSKEHSSFFDFFGLSSLHQIENPGSLSCLPMAFPTKGIRLLRNGLLVSDFPYSEPSQSLAHYLGEDYQVELSKEQAASFCRGETFPLPLGEGYYLAAYQGLGIGWFKMVQGKMKNHYPKGLRRNYKAL